MTVLALFQFQAMEYRGLRNTGPYSQNQELLKVKSVQPWEGQNIALYAMPVDKSSAFPVLSTSFFPDYLQT